MTSFFESGRTIKQMAGEAIADALADAQLELADMDAVFFANSLAGVIEGQECIRGETVMYALGAPSLPLTNVENACASGGTALHLARSSVAAGQYETVLAVGVERMRVEDKTKVFTALAGATDVEQTAPPAGSPFIDVYAKRAQNLMRESGVTIDGLAKVAAKAWSNGALNPKAQRRKSASVDEILNSRMIVEPLTVGMCALTGDGAAAVVVTSKPTSRRDVVVAASQMRTVSADPDDPPAVTAAARAAYEECGLAPTEIDFPEVHDATSPGEMLAWVGLLLCAAGKEEDWAQTRHTELDAALPVNPSGGLMARGHPIGASGLAQVYEVVTQMRGDAGARQVSRARAALSHVGGGVLGGLSTAVSTVHIFTRP
jgi:acetyl-CoA acetyltransferase